MHRLVIIAGGLVLLASAAAAEQPPAPAQPEQHVRGQITQVDGQTLHVRSREGKQATLKLAEDARIAVASRSSLSDVSQGEFIGTTAVARPDGTLRAVEVHIFPESMRGAGEGHRPWDLKPGSSMTNATVSAMEKGKAPSGAASSMTNATVSNAKKTSAGLTLVLKYPSGEKTVLVSPGTPIVKLEPADRSRLVTGANIFAAGPKQEDGTVLVKRAVVGEGGLKPPM